MKVVNIKDKLVQIGVSLDRISLGTFDEIGEYTAKRQRSRDDVNYHKYGASYRSNYERGILVYFLIREFDVKSVLEIGFGRGYSSFCAAKAFTDAGIDGKVMSIDPNVDEKFLGALGNVFDGRWMNKITINKGTSEQVFPQLGDQKFDLVIIDGDHSRAGVQLDWSNVKDRFQKFVIFDDYLEPNKIDPGICVREVVDAINEEEINCVEKELIKMDRVIFNDDRHMKELDYGQILFTKKSVLVTPEW
jgi:predicted O-methyltransferase YrrM